MSGLSGLEAALFYVSALGLVWLYLKLKEIHMCWKNGHDFELITTKWINSIRKSNPGYVGKLCLTCHLEIRWPDKVKVKNRSDKANDAFYQNQSDEGSSSMCL